MRLELNISTATRQDALRAIMSDMASDYGPGRVLEQLKKELAEVLLQDARRIDSIGGVDLAAEYTAASQAITT